MEENNLQAWKRKRSLTTAAFALQSLVLGMEYSLTFLTLWLYLKQLVPTDYPKQFYMCISIAYLISTTVFTPLVGAFVDRTRSVKNTFFVCNMLLIVGNILYSLPFSPWLLLLGRFISGAGGALKPVICSELIRCYPAEEINQKLSIVTSLNSSGFIVGPGLNFLFYGLDVWLGGWHLTVLNFPGVFLAILSLVMEVLTLIMVNDLSKEYDLKGGEEKRQQNLIKCVKYDSSSINDEETLLIENPGQTKYAQFVVVRKLFGHVDTALVLFATGFVMFSQITFDMWLPLLVVDVMQLSLNELNILVLGAGSCCLLSIFLFMRKPGTSSTMTMLLIISLFGLIAIDAAFVAGKSLPNSNQGVRAVLAAFFMLGFGGTGFITNVYFVNALGGMVESKIQTLAESVRYSSYTFGSMLGLASSAFLFDYLEICASLNICFVFIIIVCFCVRFKSFANPKIIIYG